MRVKSTGHALYSTLMIGILASALPIASVEAGQEGGENATSWNWLTDTYWIVPPANLPAILFDPTSERLAPVRDQTVYHINGYREGYFWGKNVTQVGTAAATCSSLVGSVTPQGRVMLSFTIVNSDGSISQQQGFGEMVEKRGQWTMLNQTSAPTFAHWAYMVQSEPGDASWESLPGIGMSVTAFLAQCPGDGAQPVTP